MFAIFQFLLKNENFAPVLSNIIFIIFTHYLVLLGISGDNENTAVSPLKSEPSQNFSKSGSITTSLDTADSFNLNFASFSGSSLVLHDPKLIRNSFCLFQILFSQMQNTSEEQSVIKKFLAKKKVQEQYSVPIILFPTKPILFAAISFTECKMNKILRGSS